MKFEDSAPLDFADISAFLKQVGSVDSVIVGGQALAIWTQIHAKELKSRSGMQTLSHDLDFHGTRAGARALGRKLKVDPEFAGMDEATPSVAVIKARIGQRTFAVDVIANVLGVDHRSIAKLTVEVDLPLADGTPVRIKLLHPAACLISRATNIMSPATARRDPVAYRQMKAAMDVMKVHIRASLKAGDWKDVKLAIETLRDWLVKPETYDMRAKTRADALDILKYARRLKSIDARYRERTLKPLIERIQKKRGRAR